MCENAFLPVFCSPLPAALSENAVATATNEKAFLCLPEEMTDIIIRRYVEFIHPQIPVLCLNDLLAVFEARSQKTISVLLWQALTTAIIPFLTGSELSMSGLVSGAKTVGTFLRRTKMLLELQMEASEITELQAILLLCWRFRLDMATDTGHHALMDRAQQNFEQLGSTSSGQDSALSNRGDLMLRLRWSFYYIRATSTTSPSHDFAKTFRPPSIRPPTLGKFEAEWLFLDRAQTWYRDIGTPQAFVRHLQQVSCFCKKTELYIELHGSRDSNIEQRTSDTANPDLVGGSTLPLSTVFWKARKLDHDVEAMLRARILQIDLHSQDAVTAWSGRMHYIDLILLYKITSFSLFWSEKLLHNAKATSRSSTPAQKIADDIVETNIAQQVVSISRIIDALCRQRLSLLAHNMNPQILENLSSILSSLDSEASKTTHSAPLYSRLGTTLKHSICKYREPIFDQSTSITAELDLELAPAEIIQYVRSQGLSPSETSTAGTLSVSAPATPLTSDPFYLEYISIQHVEKDCMEDGLEMAFNSSALLHATDNPWYNSGSM